MTDPFGNDAPHASGTSCSPPASAPARRFRTARNSRKKRSFAIPILLQLIATVGIAAILYPSGANWFAKLGYEDEFSAYAESIETTPDAELEAKLTAAREYNANLRGAVLQDPYTDGSSDADQMLANDPAYEAYKDMLSLADNSTAPMGQVVLPEADINLPLYPGTEDETISKGVGHLYGSSLPIGGPSTHSVLTSHSGLVNASLFTRLEDAKVGNVFSIAAFGETRYYEVDNIQTILPHETENLGIVEGEDRVTLFTCTPTGVNSHRLLVQGIRVDNPKSVGHGITGEMPSAGFPWWALIFIAGSAATTYLLFVPPQRTATEDLR